MPILGMASQHKEYMLDREPTVWWNIALAKLVAMKYICKISIASFCCVLYEFDACEYQVKMMNAID